MRERDAYPVVRLKNPANMTKSKIVAAAVGASVVLGAVLWLMTDDAEQSPEERDESAVETSVEPAGVALACNLSPGQTLAYRFRLDSTAELNPSALMPGAPAGAQLQRRQRHIKGEFLWRVMSVETTAREQDEVTVAAIFRTFEPADEDVDAPEEFATLEQTPVLLRIDERCRFLGVGAVSDVPAKVVRQWQLLASVLEMVGSRGGAAANWTATQHDATGTYLASYVLEDGGEAIQKRRKNFLSVQDRGGSELVARILDSRGIGRPAGDGAWLAAADISEDIELRTTSGAVFVRASTHAKVERLADVPDDPFWARTISTDDMRWRSMLDYAQDEGAARQDVAPGIATLSPTDALAEFRRRLDGTNHIGDAVDMLVGYLLADPDHPAAIYELLIEGKVRQGERSVLFLALEKAGGPACRDVLIDAASNPRLDRADHLRAFGALADVPKPDEDVVNAVEDAARGTTSHQSRAATLALGTLAGREEMAPALKDRVVSRLRDGLHEHADERERLLTLEAVGNAGGAGARTLERRVRELTGSERPRERARAQETLRRLGTAVDHLTLLDALERESEESVREQIGRRLVNAAGEAPPAAIEAASDMLTPAASTDIRRILIQYLGSNADDDPRARQALITHFGAERSPELLVLIGKFVPANEL